MICDALIIGAGSVGLPVAYELAKKGLKVVVIEKEHSAGRGQNRAAIGGIRATHSDPAKIQICQRSIKIVSQLEPVFGLDVDWIQGGYLYPVYDVKTELSLKALLKIQHSYGLQIEWAEPSKIVDLCLGINTNNLIGGTWSSLDGSASPLKLSSAYLELAKSQGVEVCFDEEVMEITLNGNKVDQVFTNKNVYQAGIVVNAAGADARAIGAMTGLDLPVYPDSHEAGITEPVKRFFEPMIVDIRADEGSANYYFYQNIEGQVVFCITPEPKLLGFDCDNTSTFLPMVVKRMVGLYPRLRNLRVRRTWRGLYPMTPDGFPIVGVAPNISNMYLTVGMCGQGLMLGPGLGQVLSEIIVDQTHEHDHILEELRLDREFKGNEVLK